MVCGLKKAVLKKDERHARSARTTGICAPSLQWMEESHNVGVERPSGESRWEERAAVTLAGLARSRFKDEGILEHAVGLQWRRILRVGGKKEGEKG